MVLCRYPECNEECGDGIDCPNTIPKHPEVQEIEHWMNQEMFRDIGELL